MNRLSSLAIGFALITACSTTPNERMEPIPQDTIKDGERAKAPLIRPAKPKSGTASLGSVQIR